MFRDQPSEEQLSQEEIESRIAELMASLRKYNNLHAAINAGEYINMNLLRLAAKEEKEKNLESREIKEALECKERFSKDLREAMEQVGLKREDGVAEYNIRWRGRHAVADILFLQEYKPKVEMLFQELLNKGWSERDIVA